MKTFVRHSVLVLIASVCATLNGYAQSGNFQEKKEHIEALKASFITQKLNLTRDEAQKFWPVYNEYQDAKEALRKERHEEFKKYKETFDSLSEKELTEFVDKQIIYRQRELDIDKKYHAEFKSVLPIKKVAMLYRAEDEFRKEVLKEIQNRKPGTGN